MTAQGTAGPVGEAGMTAWPTLTDALARPALIQPAAVAARSGLAQPSPSPVAAQGRTRDPAGTPQAVPPSAGATRSASATAPTGTW